MEHIEAQRTADKHVCGGCSGNLVVMNNRDGYYLRCVNNCDLAAVGMDTAWNHLSKSERECLAERNMSEMVMNISADKAVALRQYALTPRLDKAQAIEVLKTCWPEAPEQEVIRAALLCATYQLNPLMKHVFLVPYKAPGGKVTWSIQIGIGATRLAASRRGPVSFLDGPRIMSPDEQKRIRGKYEPEKIWAITKLGGKNGATSVGYGNYPSGGEEPKGCAKGNSRENMAMIRSECQALDRLYPAEMPMPSDLETVDESYEKSPLAAIEAQYQDISDAQEITAGDAKQADIAPETPQGEDIPSEEIADPFPQLSKKYPDFLKNCPQHGNTWFGGQWGLFHKDKDINCKFKGWLRPIADELAIAKGVDTNDICKEKFGTTWSQLKDEQCAEIAEGLI